MKVSLGLAAGILTMMASFNPGAAKAAAPAIRSHAPLRPLPQPSRRPMAAGPAYFVDAARGKDSQDGSKARPWKTVNEALKKLSAGDTLYLRGGEYYEDVYCAVSGTAEKPITIRSFPGEVATLNGGMPEFVNDPARAWEPAPDGVPGEYRSTRAYKNIRDVLGLFGDSNIGLQTYWYRTDMQSQSELWNANKETFIDPIYCGPGLWYDKQSGRIHVRLAHTKLTLPASVGHQIDQYQGETDPRKLPLVIARYDSLPLYVDQAMHVRFQDLVLRGAGQTALKLNTAIDIDFDRCTIYAGSYGVWAKGTGPLKMTNCGVYGMIAPWMFREENCLYSYSAKVYPPFLNGEAAAERAGATQPQPAQVTRHISRLPTHALLVTEGGHEFDTFYYPLNHDWDISYCDFTDGHDGIYPSGRDVRFHHNLVDNMQDDAVYLSSPTPYVSDGVYFYQNLIRQATIGFGMHSRGGPGGKIYVYRNVVDMRAPVQYSRPSSTKPEGVIAAGQSALLVHNSSALLHMEDVYLYQNTTLTRMAHPTGSYSAGMVFDSDPGAERRVFNNLHVYFGSVKRYPVAFGVNLTKGNLAFDGNLHWHSDPTVKVPDNYFKTSREQPLSETNKKLYPDGWDAHSIAGDPKFVAFSNGQTSVDLRLQADSPARAAGIVLPKQWPDPLRPPGETHPDIGAIPVGGEPLRVGIDGRTTAGATRQ